MTTAGHSTNFPALINRLERRQLDQIGIFEVGSIWGQMQSVPFWQILGLAAFWQVTEADSVLLRIEDMLSGCSALRSPVHYLAISEKGISSFYLGLEAPSGASLLSTMLASALPGVLLASHPATQLGNVLRHRNFFGTRGLLTGIPSRKGGIQPPLQSGSITGNTVRQARPSTGEHRTEPQQVERLVRGLQGATWGMWIKGIPLHYDHIVQESSDLLDLISAVGSQVKRQYQQVVQTMKQITPEESQGTTTSTTDDLIDRQAEYALDLLEHQLRRFDQAKTVGMWEVEFHFFASSSEALERLGVLLRAVFSGADSVPEAIRTFNIVAKPGAANSPATQLTTTELATFMQLPKDEFQGFRIAPYARFDTDPPDTSDMHPLEIGEILDGSRPSGLPFTISVDDLSKHALVTGMTGSGKTTTTINLLHQLHLRNKPFLVIEPAKAEYRDLLGPQDSDKTPTNLVPDLRVYTLGDETVTPFRLNPFEFEVIDEDNRVHVQTHIDYLKAVFNAAFILYAPMPYVLEMCLHEIFTDCGWDLATGFNTRLSRQDYQDQQSWPIFPTLADLYHKTDEVVDRLGYEDRLEMDVKAGLKARIGSLMLGSKGLMLNCRRGLPFLELLSHPTVLELERIGNDDEKAFVIGLLMTRLFEFRRLQAQAGSRIPFRHLTIIEEAHRLLKHVSTDVPIEGSNMRGQAVEVFTNMLSEIRSYGQGILIAEQIPTKLAADALKNTNLKLVHRLVAEDDRRLVGGSTNMNEEQIAYLSTLSSGTFAAYADQADYPYLLAVPDFRRVHGMMATRDTDVRAAMQDQVQQPIYEPVKGYWTHVAGPERDVNMAQINLAALILEERSFSVAWSGLMLRLLHDPVAIGRDTLEPLSRLVKIFGGRLGVENVEKVLLTLLLFAVDRMLQLRGRLYHWSYRTQLEMHEKLMTGLAHLVQAETAQSHIELSAFVRQYRENVTLPEGPFSGCAPCRVRCWLRSDIRALVSRSGLDREAVEVISTGKSHEEIGVLLARLVLNELEGLLSPGEEIVRIDMAVCLLAQLTASVGFSRNTQLRLVKDSAAELSKRKQFK